MTSLVSHIIAFGIFGIAGIIFAESGLFFGFFLPGDSLLFTAGLLASQGYLNIFLLILASFLAAVLGDSVGYAFGARLGPKLFVREKSLLFNPAHLERANAFFIRQGGKAVILARFMPVVRTFVPIVAGAARMPYGRFLRNNVLGGALWTALLPLLGFFLGRTVPNVDHYLLPIIVVIVFISFLPPAWEMLQSRKKSVK